MASKVFYVGVMRITIDHFETEVGSGPYLAMADAAQIALEKIEADPEKYQLGRQETSWAIEVVKEA